MKSPNPGKDEKPALGIVGRSKPKQEPLLSDQGSTTADESDLGVNFRKPRELAQRGAPEEQPALPSDSQRSLNSFQIADSNGAASLTSPFATARPRASGETGAGEFYRNTSKPEPAEAVHKPKDTLGKIGGRAKRDKESEVQDPPAVSQGGRQLSRPPPATVTSRTLFQPQSSPPPPPPRETSQERANSKREELKRQLESKSNANVKKKRKF